MRLLDSAVRAGVLALALCTSGCGEGKVPASSPPAPPVRASTVKLDPEALARLGVRVEPAGASAHALRLELPASLDYDLEAYGEVASPVEGRVASVRVRVGDAVKKGDVLARVQSPAVSAMQADLARAQADASVAEKNATREQSMLADHATSVRQTELAEGEAARARAALATTAAKLRVLGVPATTTSAGLAADGTVVLRAPIDGVVVRRDAVLGAFLHPQDTAFIVADTRTLWATIDVYESEIPLLAVGTEVELTTETAPGRIVRGHIKVLEPHVASESRSARARVDVDNADGALRAGTFLRAHIPLTSFLAARGDPTRGLLLPRAAVQPLGDRDVVFIERAPGEFDVRTVRVAHRTSQIVTLRDGVREGEPVAVAGAFLLRAQVTRQ